MFGDRCTSLLPSGHRLRDVELSPSVLIQTGVPEYVWGCSTRFGLVERGMPVLPDIWAGARHWVISYRISMGLLRTVIVSTIRDSTVPSLRSTPTPISGWRAPTEEPGIAGAAFAFLQENLVIIDADYKNERHTSACSAHL